MGSAETKLAFKLDVQAHWHHLLYNADGTAAAPEFQVNATTKNSQDSANVGMADNGNFAVTWSDNRSGTVETYMRLYDATGTAITGDTLISTLSGAQRYNAVDFASDGSFGLPIRAG